MIKAEVPKRKRKYIIVKEAFMKLFSTHSQTKIIDRHRRIRQDFYECIQDIALHPAVLEMQQYPHHGSTNCYQHCMNVAFYNYLWCRFFSLNARSAARAGMIHDLFLYDWHTHARETGQRFHGLTHPKTAYMNARKYFQLDRIEKDIILNHMWPVTFLSFPHTREGWVTAIVDKYCGACETGHRHIAFCKAPVNPSAVPAPRQNKNI